MPNPNDIYPSGRSPVIYMGDINTGDSTDRVLFTIPANSIIVDGRINGHVASASNALQASLSVGIAKAQGGAGNEYLKAWSIGIAQGSNFQGNVPWTNFGAQSSNYGNFTPFTAGSNSIQVSGSVAGSPGTGSGPWTVIFEVISD